MSETKKDTKVMNTKNSESNGVVAKISMTETELRQKRGGGICEEQCSRDQETIKVRKSGYKPITFIDFQTGRSCIVPADKFTQEERELVRDLIKAGGGEIPSRDGFTFDVDSKSSDRCLLAVHKGSEQSVVWAYDNCSQDSARHWDAALLNYIESTSDIPPSITETEGPWLAMIVEDNITLGTENWIANFGLSLADTWRRLPPSVRSQISSNDSEDDDITQASADGADKDNQIERLIRGNNCLIQQFRSQKKINNDLKNQILKVDRLRQDSARLTSVVSAKECRIKDLEKENAGIKRNIQQRIDTEVASVREHAEKVELNVLLAQEQRDEALRRAEQAEHMIKRYEHVMRTHGIEPKACFGNEDLPLANMFEKQSKVA